MVEHIELAFPRLRHSDYRVTSPVHRKYNCIAWAAGVTNNWWWPDPDVDDAYWPADVPLVETLESFVAAFATLGYSPCEGENYEADFEKVAIFCRADGSPTHAARQLPTGRWTSKLGKFVTP